MSQVQCGCTLAPLDWPMSQEVNMFWVTAVLQHPRLSFFWCHGGDKRWATHVDMHRPTQWFAQCARCLSRDSKQPLVYPRKSTTKYHGFYSGNMAEWLIIIMYQIYIAFLGATSKTFTPRWCWTQLCSHSYPGADWPKCGCHYVPTALPTTTKYPHPAVHSYEQHWRQDGWNVSAQGHEDTWQGGIQTDNSLVIDL